MKSAQRILRSLNITDLLEGCVVQDLGNGSLLVGLGGFPHTKRQARRKQSRLLLDIPVQANFRLRLPCYQAPRGVK
jgi:hypothetical protein